MVLTAVLVAVIGGAIENPIGQITLRNDRGDIDYLEDEQVIVCRTCGYRYPVRDGIPVMLIDEAEKPATKKKRR